MKLITVPLVLITSVISGTQGFVQLVPSKLPGSSLKMRPSVQYPLRIIELVTVATASLAVEKTFKRLPVNPNIVSFALAALYSNLRVYTGVVVASQEWVQHIAWTFFLQSSLVLSIFGSKKMNWKLLRALPVYQCVLAFTFSALGSFLGGIAACRAVSMLYKHDSTLLTSLIPISSSLVGSYIGGTANYFEVANILTKNLKITDLVNSVAAIDVAVMVLFFQLLSFIQLRMPKELMFRSPAFPHNSSDFAAPTNPNLERKTTKDYVIQISRQIKLIFSAAVLTKLSRLLQIFVPFQGSSLMILIMLGSFLQGYKPETGKIRDEFDILSEKSSKFMLCMFYAAIGLNSGLNKIQKTGKPLLALICLTLLVRNLNLYAIFFSFAK